MSLAMFESGPGAEMMPYELEILLANLKFIQNNNDLKKTMISAQSQYTVSQSEATESSIKQDSYNLRATAYGMVAGAVASAACSGYYEYKISKTNNEIEINENQKTNLKTICTAAPKVLEAKAEVQPGKPSPVHLSPQTKAFLSTDENATNKLLKKKPKEFNEEMNKTGSTDELGQIRNDIALTPLEVAPLRENLERGLKTQLKKLENDRTKQTQQQSSISQLLNSIGVSCGNAVGAQEKEQQAIQESVKILAEYLTQFYRSSRDTCEKAIDNAINQIQSLLQSMEGATFAANNSRA